MRVHSRSSIPELGLAEKHYISSLSYVAPREKRAAHYRAVIVPLILFDTTAKEGEAPKYLQLCVELDGTVTSEGFRLPAPSRNLRLEVQEPK